MRPAGKEDIPAFEWSPLGPVPVHLDPELLSDEGQPLMGLCEMDPRRISIRSTLSTDEARRTLDHEWLHMVFFDSGIRNVFPPGVEEIVVDTVSTALAARAMFHRCPVEESDV